MIFFWISLSILILAQISYISVFYFNHGDFDSDGRWILSLICTIPFSPILSFIFYLVSYDNSIIRTFIDKLFCFNFSWHSQTPDPNQTPAQQYLDEKLYKHLGFILEASIEAFPQSILQLTAIVYYNEPNIISILSILISMSSVCSKILLLVLTGNSLKWRMKLFIWLSFVVDFFGIFFIVCYAFYSPNNHNLYQYFLIIRDMYFYQFIICIVPFAVCGSIGLHLYWTITVSTENDWYKLPFVCCGISILWIIGLFITLLIMEIFTVVWAGMVISDMIPSSRLPYKKKALQFFAYFYEWIGTECKDIIDVGNQNEIIITQDEDKMIRLCIFNMITLEQHPEITKEVKQNQWETEWNNYWDEKLLEYLRKEKETQFRNVTLKSIRENCDNSPFIYNANNRDGLSKWQYRRHPTVIKTFFYEFYASMYLSSYEAYKNPTNTTSEKIVEGIGVVTLALMTFLFAPTYILSRIFNVFMPIILIIFLNEKSYLLFTDIDVFQVTMWFMYVILLILWFILAVSIMMEDYTLWHILPSTDNLRGCEDDDINDKVAKLIKNCYFEITTYPIIETIVIHYFGNDIACLVMYYFNNIQIESRVEEGEVHHVKSLIGLQISNDTNETAL